MINEEDPQQESAEMERAHAIWEFEHSVLPGWVTGTGGEFVQDLLRGDNETLVFTAAEHGGEDFAKAISVKVIDDPRGALISFPAPEEPTHCKFLMACDLGESSRLFSCELSASGSFVLGESGPQGHTSYVGLDGAEESFLQAVRQILGHGKDED